MFLNVVLCVDALMLGVFDSTICFSVLELFLLMKEKWNDDSRFKNYGLHKLQYSKTCPQRKPVINGHFVNNTSFFMVFVWNRTCTQRKLSITSELFPNFWPDEPVYNELSLNFFLFTSKKSRLGNSKQHFWRFIVNY
jgi:hypothetical protein